MHASQGGPESPCPEGPVSAYAAAEIGGLVEEAADGGPLAVVAVDIPIGLPDTGRRQADVLARKAVGPRWQSVFMTPVRPALEAHDYETAADLSRSLAGEGISRQAFALQAQDPPGRPLGTGDPAPKKWWKSTPRPASQHSPEPRCSPASRPGPAQSYGAVSWPERELTFLMTLAWRARKPAFDHTQHAAAAAGPPCASFAARRGPHPVRPNCSVTDCRAPSGRNAEFACA